MLRTVLKRLIDPTNIKNHKVLVSNGRFFASFCQRDFQFESSDGESSNSLVTRFARHIAIKNACSKDPIKYTIRYADYYPVSDIRRFEHDLEEIPVEQLPQMIIYTSVYKGRTEFRTFVDTVNRLDNECAKKVDEMSEQQIIEMLNALMYFLPNKIAQLDFYQLAIQKLVDEFSDGNSVSEFVQVCFFLGMWKKHAIEDMNHMLKNHLGKYIHELGMMDLAIICNAAFKTSTPINNKTFLERIETEILSMKEPDVPILITLLKSLRHNRVKTPETLEKVMTWIKNGDFDTSDIRAHAHILTYLAENRVADYSVVSKLVTQGTKMIHSQSRTKDISSLLWSCAYLSYDFNDETSVNRIVNIIYDKVDDEEYRNASDELVDTCLSLFMLGYKAKDMAEAALEDMRGEGKDKQRVKLDSRRILLGALVEIERAGNHPTPAFQADRLASDYLVSNRMGLQTAYKVLDTMRDELDIKSIDYVQQITELNIAGILVRTKTGSFHIELLDESNTLSDNKTPFGLMKLKCEILEFKGCDFVIINIAGVSGREKIEQIIKEKVKNFLVTGPDANDDEKRTESVSVKT